jgi:CHAD domain-containing protein
MTQAKADEAPAFVLRCGEPVPAEATRLASAQIDFVLKRLRRLDDDAVHEIRKATKRLRALVRLVRDQLGEQRYRRENRSYRDVARALSGPRDAAVVAKTLRDVEEHVADEVRPRTFRHLRRLVADLRRRTAAEHHVGRRDVQRVARTLERAQARLDRWHLRGTGWAAIEPGLHRLYRRGQSCFDVARRDASDANLHEWRKRVKDLRYVLDLLEPLWPDVVHPLAKEVDQLADALGDDHDLALLRRLVGRQGGDLDGDGPTILGLLDVRRGRLQGVAWALGPRVYQEKPRAFVRRLHGYWDVWQRGDGAGLAAAG